MSHSYEEQLESDYGHFSPSELVEACDSDKDRARIAQLHLTALRSLELNTVEYSSWLAVYTESLGESNHV